MLGGESPPTLHGGHLAGIGGKTRTNQQRASGEDRPPPRGQKRVGRCLMKCMYTPGSLYLVLQLGLGVV